MKLSVLISSFNGINDLPLFLQSLQKSIAEYGDEVEVILRDDKSTDGSADYVSKKFAWIKTIKGKETLGFVKSNNVAFAMSSGEIVCCLNQDTILAPAFIREALEIMNNNPDIAGVNTNMIMPWIMDKDKFIQKADQEELPFYEYQFTKYGFAGYFHVDSGQRETNFMTGGAFFLRRSVLMTGEELFDPLIHMYCEDTDLSLRLNRRGEKIVYAPKAVVFHNQSPKKILGSSAAKQMFRITWTRLRVLARNQSGLELLKNFPLYLFGIVKKMAFLGLQPTPKILACIAGGGVMCVFFFSLPYLLFHCKEN